MKTIKEQIIDYLAYKGDSGATVFEMTMECRTNDVRKAISDLLRDGKYIMSSWEKKDRRRWKRYYLV